MSKIFKPSNHNEDNAHKIGANLKKVQHDKPQSKPMGYTHKQQRPPKPSPFNR